MRRPGMLKIEEGARLATPTARSQVARRYGRRSGLASRQLRSQAQHRAWGAAACGKAI